MRCWRIRRSSPWLRANSIQDSTKYPNYQRNFIQFSSKLHWSRSSIDQSTGRPKSNRNCWELQPGSHLAILRQRPLYCYIPLIRKGSKLNLKMIGPWWPLSQNTVFRSGPQLGNWDYEQMVKSGIQSNPPESNISSSNTIVTQVSSGVYYCCSISAPKRRKLNIHIILLYIPAQNNVFYGEITEISKFYPSICALHEVMVLGHQVDKLQYCHHKQCYIYHDLPIIGHDCQTSLHGWALEHLWNY